MADWVSGKVTKWSTGRTPCSVYTCGRLFIRLPPGKFTKLGLEIDGERVQRAYSYVNAPGNPDLEFYLVTVPEGKLSPRLAALKPGDEVLVVSEAAGFFVLEEVPDCDTLWMLATGTALGPYLSILQEGKDLERFNNLVLVHAVRYAADLSYLPLMRELEQRYAGKLRIQTVVSRETVEGSLTGRVPFLIETGALEEAVGLPMTTDTSHVMLCGNPQMVRDTQQLLKETRQMNQTSASPAGPYDSGALLVTQASAFQRTSWVSLPNLFSPWVPTNAPRSINIMTIINVGTKRPTPHCQTLRQHSPVPRQQHPRQNHQQRPQSGFAAIVQPLDHHRRRRPQQADDNKRRRLQVEKIAACQGKQGAHGHQPDGNPDPEIAAANAPFN